MHPVFGQTLCPQWYRTQSQQRACRLHETSLQGHISSLRPRLGQSALRPIGSERVWAGRGVPRMHVVGFPFEAW